MQVWTWPPVELSDGAVEAMKWLGPILMTADHAQKYGLIAVSGVYEAGRMAFPLFGIVLAYNLARARSHDRAVYLRVLTRLLAYGVIASIPFIALGGLGFGWWPLNCMGTLAVSVCIMYLIKSHGPFRKTKAASAFLLGGALVEFWWPGGALLVWLVGTAGLTLINGNGWACASFVVLVAMVYGIKINIPRASRFFYLYYPAHLAIILLLGFRIQSPS